MSGTGGRRVGRERGRRDVLGQLDVGRPGLLERRHPERLAHDLGDALGLLDPRVPLRDRLQHPHDVDDLVGLLVQLGRGRLAGDRDHRRAVEERVGHAGDEVRGARAERAHRDGGTAGQPAMDVGHERRALLVAGRHVADALVARQRVEDVHRLLAGHGEDVLAALGGKAVDEQVGGAAGRARGGRHGPPRVGHRPTIRRSPTPGPTRCATLAAVRLEDRVRPSLNILAPELTDRIVDEAKRVLAEVGMEIRGPEMRRRLLEAGLPTNAAGDRVLFPRAVVERAIADAPKRVHALHPRRRAARRPRRRPRPLRARPRRASRCSIIGPARSAWPNSTDFVEYVRVADGLEHIAYLATAFSTNDDIEAQVSDAWRLYMTLTNSKKPVVSGAFTEHGVVRMVEMMQLFRTDRADLIARPMSIFTITATGNFRYSEDSCQNLIDCVEAGVPVEIVPVTLMGLIAPVTTVGATVFHTVDVLAGITMAQVIKPGAPVLFGGAPATFHMKVASSPMSAIEALQLDAAYVAVAKSLELPCQSYMALSDGPILDAQAGAETFGSALIAALAGVNSVSGPGLLDFLLVFSLPKLVFDNEMCGQALRFVREIKPVDDLPVGALIDQLMADQHLIMAEHTMAHWPSELYLPSAIVDRDNRENWQKAGGKDTYQRAIDEAEQRLAAYRPLETDPAIDAELRRIIIVGLRVADRAAVRPAGSGAIGGGAGAAGRPGPPSEPPARWLNRPTGR